MSQPNKRSKVLVLGMDGLDPRRVENMVREGRLPAFEKLRQSGTLSPLATSNPAESPVAWSSLATGCNPGKHGIFDFIHRNPSGYVPYLSLLHEPQTSVAKKSGAERFACPRSAEGFWRMTSDAGLPTTVVRWPVTFPAENVTGRFLSGLGVPDATGRLGKYTFYTTAPTADDTDEKVVRVSWRGDKIATHLFGPQMTGLRGCKPLRVKLNITRDGAGVTLVVGQQQERVQVGQWSEWFSVSFKFGPMQVCDALVKFRLVGTDPDLRLFATPMQIHPQRQLWPLTYPESYGAEVMEQVGPFYTMGLPEDTNAVTDNRYDLDGFLQQCSEIGTQRRGMFEHELNRFDDGVLAFVFDAGDRVQHMFWSIDDRQSPVYDAAHAKKYGHVIDDLYIEMDEILATALDAAGEETAVFVVSDHGFGPFRRAMHLNRWLIDKGYMELKGADEGRSLFADVDWSKTKAYAVGFTSLYLNLAGRESHGVVSPGDDADQLAADIACRLLETRDPESGDLAVRGVYPSQEIYSGPCVDRGPDMVVGFEPGYRASWQTALGAAPRGTIIDNDKAWAADHLVDPSAVPGVLACNVPLQGTNPAGVDLAPTILHSLGMPIPSHMDGGSWLRDQDAAHHPDASVTADQPELVWAMSASTCAQSPGCDPWDTDPGDGLDDDQRAELEKHLSDLGYI